MARLKQIRDSFVSGKTCEVGDAVHRMRPSQVFALFKKFAVGLLGLIAITFLVACGGAETATPTVAVSTLAPTRRPLIVPTTPPGWTPYSRSSYQIALPDSWQEIKLSEADIKKAISDTQANNPPLADQLRILLESGQYKAFNLYAVGNDAAGWENVAVARVALEGTNDLQAFAKAYADALPDTVRGAKVVQVESQLTVNGMRAAAFVYDISIVDASETLTTLRGVQYLYVLDSGDSYMVTLTGKTNDANKFTTLARQIATSFVAGR